MRVEIVTIKGTLQKLSEGTELGVRGVDTFFDKDNLMDVLGKKETVRF